MRDRGLEKNQKAYSLEYSEDFFRPRTTQLPTVPSPQQNVMTWIGSEETRSERRLKRNADAHLKFVRHHTLAQRLAQEVLLRKHRRRPQSSITFRHKPAAEPRTDIGNERLLADL